MVESTLTTRKSEFYRNVTAPTIDQDEATDNMDLVSGEIESLEATLEP